MNFQTLIKSPVGLTVALIGFLGVIAGVVFEVETGHDPTATIAIIGSILAASGVLGAQQSKITSNTNGTLTAKEQQISALLSAVASLLPHVSPEVANQAMYPVTGNTPVSPVKPPATADPIPTLDTSVTDTTVPPMPSNG